MDACVTIPWRPESPASSTSSLERNRRIQENEYEHEELGNDRKERPGMLGNQREAQAGIDGNEKIPPLSKARDWGRGSYGTCFYSTLKTGFYMVAKDRAIVENSV